MMKDDLVETYEALYTSKSDKYLLVTGVKGFFLGLKIDVIQPEYRGKEIFYYMGTLHYVVQCLLLSFSQAQLSDTLGISQQHVCRIANQESEFPKDHVLITKLIKSYRIIISEKMATK